MGVPPLARSFGSWSTRSATKRGYECVCVWCPRRARCASRWRGVLRLGDKPGDRGCVSVSRRTSLLLHLQHPFSSKSSTIGLRPDDGVELLSCVLQGLRLSVRVYRPGKVVDVSLDSGLEAFSRYPAHGSFAALPFQATAFTNYANQRFLSYWVGLLSQRRVISRVKLTCLTTV